MTIDRIPRRGAKMAAIACAVLIATVAGAAAQSYPDRPIRVVVPFAAGGATDIVTRIVTEKAATLLGQQFVIENMAGAGGNLGTNTIARAEPDGYRLLVSASGPLATNKWLVKQLPYDAEKDFEPISLLATLPNVVVVTKSLPVSSLKELVAWVKAKPEGEVPYSSIGIGSSQHLAAVYFEQVTGTKMNHVPYRAAGNMATDLMTGVIPVSFQLVANINGQLKSGDIRALAIAAKTRSAALPETPTTAEAGMPDFVSAAWFAMLAPKATPKAVLDKLNGAIVTALADAGTRSRLIEAGAEPTSSTPAELAALISADIVKWRDIVAKSGLRPAE